MRVLTMAQGREALVVNQTLACKSLSSIRMLGAVRELSVRLTARHPYPFSQCCSRALLSVVPQGRESAYRRDLGE
jgi:hypothetical protein